MFQEGNHYKNRRFGFTVTAVLGDRMLVVMENGDKAVLSFELQSRIQNNIKIAGKSMWTSTGLRPRQGALGSEQSKISGWQLTSLVKFKESKNGGIVAECRDCQVHSSIFDVDELREFYLIHPKHKTNANDGYYDPDEIDKVISELRRQPAPKPNYMHSRKGKP